MMALYSQNGGRSMLEEMSRQSDYVKTALRLPRDLHRKLLTVAAENERSLNAELLDRLAASFVRDSLGERVSALEKLIRKR
jgi:predicted HicB family RNase H-like nuclease